MRRVERFFLIVVSVIALCLSGAILFLFYPVSPVTDTIQNYQSLFPVINIILAIFGGVLCLCFFLLILLLLIIPKRSDTLTVLKEKSRLQFSRRAIESTVRCSFQDVPGINFAKVRVKIHKIPEKSRVFVKLSAKDPDQLMHLSETIKEKIEAALQSSLALAVRSVDIAVTGVNTEYQDQHPEKENESTRVV